MQLIDNILKAVSDFRQLITALTNALNANTAVTSALLEATQKIQRASTATETATAYLASAERHRREQGGLRHEF
jgi:hypothetical protein